jgi:hypothetical protein
MLWEQQPGIGDQIKWGVFEIYGWICTSPISGFMFFNILMVQCFESFIAFFIV